MRKNRSKYLSKKYPNLYRYPDSPCWVFRKHSSEKGEEFKISTGEEKNEAQAYKIGIDAFNAWLGTALSGAKAELTIRDLARSVMAATEGKKERTLKGKRNQVVNHLLPAWGHLKPSQMSSLRWETYIAEERKAGRDRKFFNLRKALNEILRRAHEEGLIDRVPKLINPDKPAAPPKYLQRQDIRAILHEAHPTTKLLAFIMWKQGPRPGEALQYRYSMIKWREGPHGTIHIPGETTKTGRPRAIPLNSRVSRILKFLKPRTTLDLLFPSPVDPERAQREYDTGWNSSIARANEAREKGQPKISATIYNLRDTFITDRLNEGVSSTLIAKYVDSSTEMIDRKYAVATQKAMERIAR